DGARINVQLAAATALSYYHRPGDDGRRWVEPPTLFNPFWRATLVSPATDSDARPNTSRPGRLQLTLDRLGAEGTWGRVFVDGLLRKGSMGCQCSARSRVPFRRVAARRPLGGRSASCGAGRGWSAASTPVGGACRGWRPPGPPPQAPGMRPAGGQTP